MRKGLENPVAVYSLSAVSPGRPQSQVGPVARRPAWPHTNQKSAGSADRRTSMAAIPTVETVPACAAPADRAKPLAAVSAELTRAPMSCSVMGSKAGRNQVAPSPSATHPAARRSEEHTSELQSLRHLVCRLLLEK